MKDAVELLVIQRLIIDSPYQALMHHRSHAWCVAARSKSFFKGAGGCTRTSPLSDEAKRFLASFCRYAHDMFLTAYPVLFFPSLSAQKHPLIHTLLVLLFILDIYMTWPCFTECNLACQCESQDPYQGSNLDEGSGSGNDRPNSRYSACPFWILFTVSVTLNDARIT
jgi:hypothetical protein